VNSFLRLFSGTLLWLGLVVISLTACSPPNHTDSSGQGNVSAQQLNKTQAHFFLESLRLIEKSGRQLQRVDQTKALIEQALSDMDAGMALAFEVKATFLDQFDVRLSKNFQRYFIDGVQTYRLGVEAADPDEQEKGLALLNLWTQFWGSNQSVILQKIGS